ncbi:UNVERIFIED_CONTAM: hypothetical protein Slati_2481800 [Sesamum latifolium]|uniref:Uncharacterized protein n=1 Tax=Sesamum latifolium TaxID=2727402 RepID=A0AAW2WF01_9LAMI
MEFQAISGQRVSLPKSSFVVSPKAPLLIKHIIKRITGFVLKPLPFTYLGAPIYVGRKKIEYFDTLIESLASKVGGWEKKFLSYGSRLSLIKSVLTAMPIHLISVLKPPVGTIWRIERLFNKFFWGSSGTVKRLHWSSWHHIYRPVEEGALGVRLLNYVVNSFSMKLWWRFRASSSLWSNFLERRYCKRSCPVSTRAQSSSSPNWRRLKMGQDLAEGVIFRSLGDWNLDKLSRVLPAALVQVVNVVPFDRESEDKMARNASKFDGFRITARWIIARVWAHLWRLYKAGIMRALQWKGDLSLAFKIGFKFNPPAARLPQLVRWIPPPRDGGSLTVMALPKAIPARQEVVASYETCRVE